MSLNAGGGGCRVSANEYSCAHEAQISIGDPTPYLTYVIDEWFRPMASTRGKHLRKVVSIATNYLQ
jgi:hypothetical protein